MEETYIDPDSAAAMAVNAVLMYLQKCGLQKLDAKLAWTAGVLEAVNTRVKQQPESNLIIFSREF